MDTVAYQGIPQLKNFPVVGSVHAHPELVEHAAVMAAYQKGGMIKAEIDGILAEEFCRDRLAPVVAAYEDEKARILADAG